MQRVCNEAAPGVVECYAGLVAGSLDAQHAHRRTIPGALLHGVDGCYTYRLPKAPFTPSSAITSVCAASNCRPSCTDGQSSPARAGPDADGTSHSADRGEAIRPFCMDRHERLDDPL